MGAMRNTQHKYEDNIKMNLKWEFEIVTQGAGHRRTLVNFSVP